MMINTTKVTWTITFREDKGEPTACEFKATLIPTRLMAIQTAHSYRRAGKVIVSIVGTDGSAISASEYDAYVPPGMARPSARA
jgi:hypothetical protein